MHFSRILLINLELPTLKIEVFFFFKNFIERFQNSYQLKTGLSKNYFQKILFADSKTSTTKTIHFKIH